jgi:hypothetical protein
MYLLGFIIILSLLFPRLKSRYILPMTLCASCESGIVMQGELDTVTVCAAVRGGFEVPFQILSCTAYEPKHELGQSYQTRAEAS